MLHSMLRLCACSARWRAAGSDMPANRVLDGEAPQHRLLQTVHQLQGPGIAAGSGRHARGWIEKHLSTGSCRRCTSSGDQGLQQGLDSALPVPLQPPDGGLAGSISRLLCTCLQHADCHNVCEHSEAAGQAASTPRCLCFWCPLNASPCAPPNIGTQHMLWSHSTMS